MPAPRPRHPKPKNACSPRHARATVLFPLGRPPTWPLRSRSCAQPWAGGGGQCGGEGTQAGRHNKEQKLDGHGLPIASKVSSESRRPQSERAFAMDTKWPAPAKPLTGIGRRWPDSKGSCRGSGWAGRISQGEVSTVGEHNLAKTAIFRCVPSASFARPERRRLKPRH
eukprot:gene20732-biopygen19135